MSRIRPRPEAVLWDLDGTLIDSEPIYIEVADGLARTGGGDGLDESTKRRLVARPMDDLVDAVAEASADQSPDRAELARLINSGVMERLSAQVPWRRGARRWLSQLRRTGCLMGLATLSYRDYVDLVLDDLGFNPFAAIVAGDEPGLKPKPDPDPYLRLARSLEVDPAGCLVLEDSVIGVQAGRAAGCQVIALHAEEKAARRLADQAWSSLIGRGPSDLGWAG
ncbi:MAG: HAD family phosphatase [Propionibacteriaceae bacterium]|nr:HAD family phosphatase [Propionibacteriaceae bacterium]